MRFLRLQTEGIKIPDGNVAKITISLKGLIYEEENIGEIVKEDHKIQTQIQLKYSEILDVEEGFLDEIEELKENFYFKAFIEPDEKEVALSNKFEKAV